MHILELLVSVTLIGWHSLPVKHNHWHAALMTKSAQNDVWQILTLPLSMAMQLLPTFRSCFLVSYTRLLIFCAYFAYLSHVISKLKT